MTPKTKKIIFVAVTVSVISVGILLYLKYKKKAASLGPNGETLTSTSSTGTASGSWSDSGSDANPFRIFGYAKTNASKGADPVGSPHIKVFSPDGKQYGAEYVGDASGAYSLYVPSGDYITDITAPGYMTYHNVASKISNGYKLFMRKIGE